MQFLWNRNRVFDRVYAYLLYQRCLEIRNPHITKLDNKPATKKRPVPLSKIRLSLSDSVCYRYYPDVETGFETS